MKNLLACLGICFLGLAGADAQQFSGRLTLVSGTPVMTANALNQTTVYFTPYHGNTLPVYDPTSSDFEPTPFTELSQALTDTTHSPAAAAATKVYDLFVWNNGGTITLSRGPLWTSDTVRSAGTALTLADGIYVNSVAITNGPAAGQGTYVGTIITNTTAKCDFNQGTVASGGGAATIGIWNYYNRRPFAAVVSDNKVSWSYSVTAWRAADNSTNNRVTYITGLNEDTVSALYYCYVVGPGGGVGVDLDSTTAAPMGEMWTNSSAWASGGCLNHAGLGKHYLQAVEFSPPAGTSFEGADGFGSFASLQVHGSF